MSIFQNLIKQIESWGQSNQPSSYPKTTPAPSASGNNTNPQKLQQANNFKREPIILAIAVVSLTSVVGHRFYNQPRLAAGTVAPQTIYAPEDGVVEDLIGTEEKRKDTRNKFVPILVIDPETNTKINEELEAAFKTIEETRATVISYPFIAVDILSLQSQESLYYANPTQWQALVDWLQEPESYNLSLDPDLRKIGNELKAYQERASTADMAQLLTSIEQARSNRTLNELEAIPLEALSPDDWQQTQTTLRQTLERVLAQGISPGLPPQHLAKAIRLHLKGDIPPVAEANATALLINILQPNLKEDREKTKESAEQAAQAVKTEIIEIAAGEIIVRSGEEISPTEFILLDHFNLSRRQINWEGILGSAGLVIVAVGIFRVVQGRVNPGTRSRDYVLILLLSLSTPLLTLTGVPYTNLPAVGLLLSSFYSPALGVTVVSLITGLTGFSTVGVGLEYLLAGAAGGVVAAAVAGLLRSREELAFLGGAVGVTQGSANLIFNLILSASAGAVWYIVLPEAVLVGISGVAWSIVALGISPYLERFFDLVTPTRLAELANPNRPLLKRLATEAPGTFQHTLFVSSLAEAAGRELGCNVELIRAGTLYHDIGKMHDCQGFIENQMGGPNKHDQINDPLISADIIKRHVSEGLVMAKRCGLPKAVRDFIPEHQGTLLISYFYFKAKEQGNEDIPEEEFRYDGPIPQSRETGIVMLADACEAALRSLKQADPKVALSVVQKILKARWQDHQLTDSGLRWEELPKIAEIFIQVWQQSNHQRIAYPKGALELQPSKK